MALEMHDRGVDLIRRAFSVARDSGSPEWHIMTTAVLKNRLLDLTGRSFNESDWDATSFGSFLDQFSDIVDVDFSVRPPLVTLLQEDASQGSSAESSSKPSDLGPRRRIRRDLWNAVLDYSSSSRYRWNGQRAVAAEPGDSDETLEPLWLPTLTEDEFRSWRTEFVGRQTAKNPSVAGLLAAWLEHQQPLTALPSTLRIPWVVELKRRVLDRLIVWFQDKEISLPSDIVISDEPRTGVAIETEALREHVLAAIREMSRAELEGLWLPATVLLRNKS